MTAGLGELAGQLSVRSGILPAAVRPAMLVPEMTGTWRPMSGGRQNARCGNCVLRAAWPTRRHYGGTRPVRSGRRARWHHVARRRRPGGIRRSARRCRCFRCRRQRNGATPRPTSGPSRRRRPQAANAPRGWPRLTASMPGRAAADRRTSTSAALKHPNGANGSASRYLRALSAVRWRLRRAGSG